MSIIKSKIISIIILILIGVQPGPLNAQQYTINWRFINGSCTSNSYFVHSSADWADNNCPVATPVSVTELPSTDYWDYSYSYYNTLEDPAFSVYWNSNTNLCDFLFSPPAISYYHRQTINDFYNCDSYLEYECVKTGVPFSIYGIEDLNKFCSNKNIQMTIEDEFGLGATFNWRYRFKATESFQSIQQTSTGHLNLNLFSFSPLLAKFKSMPDDILQTDMYIEVIVSNNGYTWTSQSRHIIIYKTPPSIASIVSSKICPDQSTAKALVTVVNDGYPVYWIKDKMGRITSPPDNNLPATVEVELSQGTHTLITVLTSDGMVSPNCPSNMDSVTMVKYPTSFNLTGTNFTTEICPSETYTHTAPISVNNLGKTPYSIWMTKDGSSFTAPTTTNNGTRTYITVPQSLTNGLYWVYIRDQCNSQQSGYIRVSAPRPNLSYTQTQSSCNDPYSATLSRVINTADICEFDRFKITETKTNTIVYNTSDNPPCFITHFDWETATFSPNSPGTYRFRYDYRIRSNSKTCTTYSPDYVFTPLSSPYPLSNAVNTSPTCHDFTNGSIQLTANTNNLRMYFTAEADTSILQTGSTFVLDNLPAGDYPIRFTRNVAGCNDSYPYQTITLPNPPEVPLSATKADDCTDEASGIIRASSESGKNYSFTLRQGSNLASPIQSGEIANFAGLSKGQYTLQAKEEFGYHCESTIDTINIYAGMGLSTQVLDNIVCYGDSVRLLNEPLAGMEGSGQYALTLQEATGEPYPVSIGTTWVGKGNYTITFRDLIADCPEGTNVIPVNGPDSPLMLAAKSPTNAWGYEIDCYGTTQGTVNANASGGGTVYLFTLQPESGTPLQTSTGNFTALPSGIYRVQVADDYGCIRDTLISLSEPTALVPFVTESNAVACGGDSSGYLVIGASGGVAPYTFAADNKVTFIATDTLKNLPAGEHIVWVRDAAGCDQSVATEVNSLTPPIEVESKVSQVSCAGADNGSAEVVQIHDTASYQYTWSGLPTSLGNLADGLAPGNYQVSITDVYGCVKTLRFTITEPEELTFLAETNPVCWGERFGTATLTATGGTPPYVYQADAAAIGTSPVISSLTAGTHTLAVADANGCLATGALYIDAKTEPVTSDFLVASQINLEDTAVLVDISMPRPDSLTWHFDPAIQVIDANPSAPLVKFPWYGHFAVTMDCWYDGCAYPLSKSIEVTEKGDAVKSGYLPEGIKTVTASPNPNNGKFEVVVELYDERPFSLFVHSVSGTEQLRVNIGATNYYKGQMVLPTPKAGTYIVSAVAEGSKKEAIVVVY